jgi:hypothetical protein
MEQPRRLTPERVDKQLADRLEQFRQRMPTSLAVVQEACRRLDCLSGRRSCEEARNQFNSLLRALFDETLVVLEEFEADIDGRQVLQDFVVLHRSDVLDEREQMRREGDDVDSLERAVVRLLCKWHRGLHGVFLSVSQSRKQRAGKDFEYQIQVLLELAEIPHQVQSKRERADFILPSSELLETDRPRAVLLSAKRTLRERWQEVVDELQRVNCPNTYLATADEEFTSSVANEIKKRNIYLVTWDDVKKERFANDPGVVSYSKFMQDICTHFLPQWNPIL